MQKVTTAGFEVKVYGYAMYSIGFEWVAYSRDLAPPPLPPPPTPKKQGHHKSSGTWGDCFEGGKGTLCSQVKQGQAKVGSMAVNARNLVLTLVHLRAAGREGQHVRQMLQALPKMHRFLYLPQIGYSTRSMEHSLASTCVRKGRIYLGEQ